MKATTLFLSSLLCFAFLSCSKDEEKDNKPDESIEQVLKENIVGEWVADYATDDAKGYRWEILKFQESGIMYFSNYSEYGSHDYVNGTYSIDGKVIKTNCQLGWANFSTTYNAELHVEQMNTFTMKATIIANGKTLVTNTYNKVVGNIELDNESITPNYQQLLGGEIPSAYVSHNSYIATVDDKGCISSQWSGSTFIDLKTNKGTAVLQVTVNSIFYFDYENYIGESMKNIVKVFEQQTSTEKNVLVYNYNNSYYPTLQQKSGNWENMRVRLSSISGLVDAITLYARPDINFTDYQIEDFLKTRYTSFKSETGEDGNLGNVEKRGNTTFFIGESLQDATLGVSWNKDTRALRFFSLTGNQETMLDYGHLIGMDINDLKAIMGKPSSGDGETWIAYTFNNKYVNSVVFRFTNRDTKQLRNTVQEINVRLVDNWVVEAAQEILDNKYTFDNEGSGYRMYYVMEPKMDITLYSAPTNQIQYLNKDSNI